jgi:hypothetical protein
MRTWFMTIAVSIALMAGSAQAQSAQNVVSSEVWIEEVRQQGELTGCAVRFSIGFQDHVYRRGAVSGIGGTIGIYSVARQKPQVCAGGSLKVMGVDLYQGRVPNAFTVANAYLSVPSKVLNRQMLAEAHYQCDEPTAFCGVYGLSNALNIAGVIADKHAAAMAVVLNRHNGIDISVPITIDEKARLQFAVCWLSLMAEVQACVEALQVLR